MNIAESKPKVTLKLIAASILVLLGIILAFGYPTGGVRANRTQTKHIVSKTVITPQSKTTSKAVTVKKDEPKKKRVVRVVPPPSNDNSDDEGC